MPQRLVRPKCPSHIRRMLNLLSFLFGIASLIIVIPAQIPFLGWANWVALPVIVLGIVAGALSSKNSGRDFCLLVLFIASVRLMLGGGFF